MTLYDVREIRFIKSAPDQAVKASSIGPDGEPLSYVCLGHFDKIEFFDLKPYAETQGACLQPLLAIRERAKEPCGKNVNYIYPLYVLRTIDGEDIASIRSFWSSRNATSFIVVTRIHCDKVLSLDENGTHKPFIERLTSLFTGRENDRQVCFSANDGDASLEGAFYESLELGDIVGIMKSDSLVALLRQTRRIYQEDYVSDVYTYCCVGSRFFEEDKKRFHSMLKALPGVEKVYISSRFSIRDVSKAEKYFSKLRQDNFIRSILGDFCDHCFYVTGTADAAIEWGKRTERELIQIIRAIVLCRPATEDGASSFAAFDDVITRIGLPYPMPDGDEGIPVEASPQRSVVSFLTDRQYDWVFDQKQKFPEQWSYSLRKLIATLKTMCTDCMMDDLSMLLVKGVAALVERLHEIYGETQDNIAWAQPYNEEISETLDLWMALINDITHLEGQLAQHPELHPIRFFIPSIILLFEQRFVSQCAELLEDISATRPFAPVLVPCSVDHVDTCCILDSTDNTARSACPLSIRLPSSLLYDPYKVSHILCHEIAHYCGDEPRKREDRLASIVKCLADWILRLWRFLGRLDDFFEASEIEHVHDSMRKDIAGRLVALYANHSHADVAYLSHVRQIMYNHVIDVLDDHVQYDAYINFFFRKTPAPDVASFFKMAYDRQRMQLEPLFLDYSNHHMDLLLMLYRECYADIAMILMLRCDFDTYFQCVYEVEFERLQECGVIVNGVLVQDEYEDGVIGHFYRMALVIQTMRQLDPFGVIFEPQSDSPYGAHPWYQEAQGVLDDSSFLFTNGLIYAGRRLQPVEFDSIQTYLLSCAESLQAKFSRQAGAVTPAQELKECLDSVGDTNFNWIRMRQYTEGIEENTETTRTNS